MGETGSGARPEFKVKFGAFGSGHTRVCGGGAILESRGGLKDRPFSNGSANIGNVGVCLGHILEPYWGKLIYPPAVWPEKRVRAKGGGGQLRGILL